MTRLRRLVAGAGFRFAMLFTVAFMVCVAVIGLIARRAVVVELETQARQHVEAEASALVDEFVHGGRPDLDAALAGRLRGGRPHYRYSVVEGAGGSSNVVEVASTNAFDQGISVHRILDDNLGVIVADDLSRVRAVRGTIDRAFLSALGVAAVLGLCTGGLLSGTLLRRLDRVTRAAENVAAGDLASRIPLSGSRDEFDRLATTLNRMLDRIVALLINLRQVSTDIAHDLRTPMSRLRQDLESVHRREATAAEYRHAVARAISDIDGILDIFAALLRIAQVESGSGRSGFRTLDLSALAAEVAEAFKVVAEDEGRTLVTDIAAGVVMEGDRELLVQLLVNLVENALQHTPAASRIGIGVSSSNGETATVWVEDEGLGIPHAERSKVFRRFYRLDGSRSGEGHGLGLSLVAAVAELHGARVSLSDNAPGLRAELELPIRKIGPSGSQSGIVLAGKCAEGPALQDADAELKRR